MTVGLICVSLAVGWGLCGLFLAWLGPRLGRPGRAADHRWIEGDN